MIPHPILATDDDAEYVMKTVLSLPELMEELFRSLDALFIHADGSEAVTSVLYSTIRYHLRILSTVPPSAYRISETMDQHGRGGKVNAELPKLLGSLNRLFLEDVMKVGPRAPLWKKKCKSLATECANHMRHSTVSFPLISRIRRKVVTPANTLYALGIICFFLSVVLAVVVLISIPIIHPARSVRITVSVVATLLLSFFALVHIFFFIKVTYALQSLYDEVFEEQILNSSGYRMSSFANARASSDVRCSVIPKRSLVHGVSSSDMVGGMQAAKGFFTIPYGDEMGYIDSRQLDAQVVMIAYDQQFRITRWNNAAEVMTGFLEDGCVGKPLSELVQTPSGESIVDEIQRARRGKPIKIKLCALATPPNILHTIVTPIMDGSREAIGSILICANASDTLRHYRIYLHHYLCVQAMEALSRVAALPSISKEDNIRIVSIHHFMKNFTPPHLEMLSREMTTEWEWMNADQLLSRALGDSISHHVRTIDPLFPPTVCVSPVASKTLGIVTGKLGSCVLNLTVINLASTVFALSVSVMPRDAKTTIPYDTIEKAVNALLLSSAGSITPVEDRLIFNFPCQVAPITDDVDEEDHAHNNIEELQLTQSRTIINCTVNVVTLITNMVDQYNLSLSLLKTMFVSLASVQDRSDLEKRFSAQPCEVDVVICDGEWLSRCRDLLLPKNASQDVLVIPFLPVGAPLIASLNQVIRVPVVSRDVHELMIEVGKAVATRKNAISAKEERERILTMRQDSPWTRGKLLGRGSQGAVYEATSDLTGGKMAVKIFYFTSGSEGSINRLLNEIKIMCSLNHPNIVHYFHSERTETGVHLFMELCDASLTDVAMRGREPNQPPLHLGVLQIVRQVLTAITYLHSRGITHRDVKPQNILLKGTTIKLTDFGTAKEGSTEKEVRGTLRYMAPEVYKGEAHSLPCDIWSTGCLICELLCCPPAFMDDANLLNSMTSAAPYLKNLPDIPVLLDFVRKCFDIVPEKRATSRELLAHPLLRMDTPHSDIERYSVFSAAKGDGDCFATFSLNSMV